MLSKLIVSNFVNALVKLRSAETSLMIRTTNYTSFDLTESHSTIDDENFLDSIEKKHTYDFIAVDIPLGMGSKKFEIGGETISIRKNWGCLSKALHMLSFNGLCIASVEPPAFGIAQGPKFVEVLAKEGFYLAGVFNTPPNLLDSTSIRPVIVAFSREEKLGLFVAELQTQDQAVDVARAFVDGDSSDALHKGISLPDKHFDGFECLKARLHI